MDPMTEFLARSVIRQRIATADEGREGRRLERERREERRRGRAAMVARWRAARMRRRSSRAARTLESAPRPRLVPAVQLAAEVSALLTAAAYRVDEDGTTSERPLLEALAEVSAASAAGTAAALVDWSGTEASRLRAFG
ncbi:MAG: hypothetical protein ABIO16_11820, partial [Nocardioides sp.]